MKKERFERFIKKYKLNNEVDGVIVEFSGDTLTTNFKNKSSDLVGMVKATGIDISSDDVKFGIFNSDLLLRILKLLNDDFRVQIHSKQGLVHTMQLFDENIDSKLLLADTEVIGDPPTLNELPEMDYNNVPVETDNLMSVLNSIKAIKDCESVALISDENLLYFRVNYSDSHKTDTIDISIGDSNGNSNFILPFNSSVIQEVIHANLDADECYLDVTEQGLMELKFKSDGISSNYYIVKNQ